MSQVHQKSSILLLCAPLFFSLLLFSGASTLAATEENSAVDVEELFRQAMAERDKGDPYESIKLFHSILSSQGSLHRARLELAVAYQRTMQYEEAIKYANQVLADPDVPQDVRLAILAFLAKVKKEQEMYGGKNYWSLPLTAGFMNDSNVTTGPGSDLIPGLQLRLLPDFVKDSDWARIFSAGIDHTYTTGKIFRTGNKPSHLIWQSGASYYYRGYQDRDAYNLNIFSLRTGPGLISRERVWRTNLNFQWDRIYFGSIEHLADFYSFLPSITWNKKTTGDLEITLDGIVSSRDYHRAGDTGRDSLFVNGRLSVGYVFPSDTITVYGGVMLFNDEADKDRFTNSGWEVFGGTAWNLTKKTSLYGRARFRSSNYDGIESAATSPRDEEETQYAIGLNQKLWKRGKTELDLHAEVLYTDHESNIYWYDYDRTQSVVILSLTL
jgi:tetratricopeptide (TPR) repeat protein